MPLLTIDGREVRVPEGATLLDAARELGIEIPTLCHRQGHPPLTSCFVCVVRVNGGARLVSSCATVATEGMVVESETAEVQAARRTALELLLGDHLGDCIGPCQSTCPAHLEIPRMLRQIAEGDYRGALVTVKERIPLPAVLGRICPELCEKSCRRAEAEGAVSICLLKRFVADQDLASPDPYLPACAPATGKRVAVVGSGPAGLSAAYYLAQMGHACTLFDEHEAAGGMLRYGVPEEDLPREVLNAEISLVARLGAEFRCGVRLGADLSLEALRREYDAVLLAVGQVTAETAVSLGLEASKQGIRVDRETLATSVDGVFAAGSAALPSRHAVRAVADGRLAARAISRYLGADDGPIRDRPYSVHIGRMEGAELARFMAGKERRARVTLGPRGAEPTGFTPADAAAEARRCLHCECAGEASCLLRKHAAANGARPGEYRGDRRTYGREETHPEVVYEAGKCIACGICVAIAREAQEELGLTFIGRGFQVRVGVPFGDGLDEGLRRVARECARACPTAAIALRKPEEHGGEQDAKPPRP